MRTTEAQALKQAIAGHSEVDKEMYDEILEEAEKIRYPEKR